MISGIDTRGRRLGLVGGHPETLSPHCPLSAPHDRALESAAVETVPGELGSPASPGCFIKYRGTCRAQLLPDCSFQVFGAPEGSSCAVPSPRHLAQG